jgi:hypothetical protein
MALGRESLEYLSLFTYLKEVPLANEFSQEVTGSPLIYDTKTDINGQQRNDYFIIDPDSAFAGLVNTDGRGLLSFELNSSNSCSIYSSTSNQYVPLNTTPFKGSTLSIPSVRESNLIIVRDQTNAPLPRDYYRIDYKNARIKWPSATTPNGALSLVPTKIDYRFHMVSLIDGYPNNEEPPELPIVALIPMESSLNALQIGPGIKYMRSFIIDIYANNNLELMEITSKLQEYLYNKRIPVIDFNRTGMPLKNWGVINEDFIKTVSSNGIDYETYLTLNPGNGNTIHIQDLKKLSFYDPRTKGSDLHRHRGTLAFSTCTFSDRDPKLVGSFTNMEPPVGGFDSIIYPI